MGQDCPSVLLYMMHSNNNNNIYICIYTVRVQGFLSLSEDCTSTRSTCVFTYFGSSYEGTFRSFVAKRGGASFTATKSGSALEASF